jgi:CRISPR-associated endonuclease Csn1
MLERLPIREDWVMGVDLGIGSCGTALVQLGQEPRILFMGSRCFEVPEFPKDKELKNKTRRTARLMRRTLRRRRQRMTALRRLFAEKGLLAQQAPDGFHHRKDAPDPWRSRSEGLSRRLTNDEFAVALLHIAKHRGFKSTRKSDTGANAPKDNQEMLRAVAANAELAARYETAGEMLHKDARFARRKRNTDGDYSHTLPRDLLRHEVATLFNRQRALGNEWATDELEQGYAAIAFHQRPVNDSEDMVGTCPLEAQHGRREMRAARHAPSFELFRLVSKLNTLSVRLPGAARARITPEQVRSIAEHFAAQKTITYAGLRRMLGLAKQAVFEGISAEKEKRDICTSAGCAAGTHALRTCLGEVAWRELGKTPELLDRVAAVLAFRDDLANIEHGIREVGLKPEAADALIAGARNGAFGHYQKAGHISAKAARAMVPYLLEGTVYSEAAALAGYDHAAERAISLDDIRNAVVVRSLREARAQVWAVLREFGARPGSVQIELARDIGKGPDERKEIERGIEKRTAERERLREQFTEDLGQEPSGTELLKYELWKEQDHKCIYTQQHIRPTDLLDSSNTVQIDHVLPRKRSQDNSYTNRVLCFTSANQDKKGRTPFEWFGSDEKRWEAFEAWVRTLKIKGFKKRNLLLREFDAEREEKFVNRNLNDTRYASRALQAEIKRLYPENDSKLRVFARPGPVTAILRKSWGLEVLKKDRDGSRLPDDRHHAADALVCACCTNSMLMRLTKAYQDEEAIGRENLTPTVSPPWSSFLRDAMAAYEKVFVSRSERRRARGQGHLDTIRQMRVEGGATIVYERKSVAQLTLADLARIKDPERNQATIAALKSWMERGKPEDAPPLSPKGDPIRKVRLKTNTKTGVRVRDGLADNAAMVRVDVFAKDGEFFLVPVYVHQVMNQSANGAPPNRAIVGNRAEDKWVSIDSSYDYCLALFPDCYVELVKPDGQVIEGYYRATDRNTGALTVSPQHSHDEIVKGIGARRLRNVRKFSIDRLGRKFPVGREKRTWHGVVCT